MSKEIELTRGYVTIVDDADYEWLSQYKWHARNAGGGARATRTGLKGENKRGTSIDMARMIMGAKLGEQIDHINHNVRDNRRANLRVCTLQQNAFNRRPKGGKLYKGVCETRTSKKRGRRWIAQICFEQKRKHIGTFSSPQDAAKAYDRAAIRLFGEFACTNFPKSWYEVKVSA